MIQDVKECKMRKWILIPILALLIITTAQAGETIFQPNNQETLFASCIDSGSFIASSANISIYYSNGSSFLVDQPMQNYTSGGNFNFTFTTPTALGTYDALITCRRESDGATAQNSATFQIKDFEEESGLGITAIVLFFVFISAAMAGLGTFLVSYKLAEPAPGKYKLTKLLNFRLLGFGLILISPIVMLVPFTLITMNTLGLDYSAFLERVFAMSLFLIPMLVFLVLVIFVWTFAINQIHTNKKDWFKGGFK